MDSQAKEEIRKLAEEVMKPEFFETWYHTPNQALNGRSPKEMVEAHKEDEVKRGLWMMIEGIPI